MIYHARLAFLGAALLALPAAAQIGDATGRNAAPKPAAARVQPAPPSDLAALAAANQASGVLSAAASDPRNTINSQPNSYVANSGFFKLPPGRVMGSSSAVAVDSKGHVWVADRCGANDCAGSALDPIMEFDAEGNFIKSFGAGKLLFPHGLFIDAQGHIWVTDGHVGNGIGNDVLKFDQDGHVLMTLGTPGASGNDAATFNEPNAVLVAPDGTIFVTDGHDVGLPHNARVMAFDAHGKFLRQWGGHGVGGGQFEMPHCLAMDSASHLYVGDRGNNRIQVFDQSGKLLKILTQFGRPSGIAVDRNDVLYAADSESRAVPGQYGWNPGWKRGVRIGSVKDGIVRAFIPDTEPAPDTNTTSGGEGIGVDARGTVYVAEVRQRTVLRFTPR